MALPQIKTPEFTKTLPVSKTPIKFRPYTVGDEKLLLAAASARDEDPKFFVSNTLTVIRNCISDKRGLLETLSAADVEWLLLQIRAKSVSEKIDIKYTDENGDGKEEIISLDIEKFYIDVPEDHEYKINLTDDIGVVMRDLRFAERIGYLSKFKDLPKTDVIYETIVDCVESIFDADQVYKVGENTSKEEVRVFIEQLTGVSSKLYNFVATMPQIAVDFVTKAGNKITLTGRDIDFLTLSPAI